MSDLLAELLEAFREEYREHLEGVRAALDGADLAEALRRAHSLKAAARCCDLEVLAVLAQGLETLFSRAHRGELAFGPEAAGVARLVTDAVETWATAWEAGQMPADPTEALAALDRVLTVNRGDRISESEARARVAEPLARASDSGRPTPPASPDDTGPDAELLLAFQMEYREHVEGIRSFLADAEAGRTGIGIDEAFRRAHSLKGCARAIGLRPAEVVAHRLEDLFAQVREGGLVLRPDAIRAIHRGLESIEDATACLLDKQPLPDPAPILSLIDAAVQKDDVAGGRVDKVKEEPAARPDPAPLPSPAEAVRVSTDHLDRLLHSAEQLLAEGLGQDRALRELDLLRRDAGELAREWDATRLEAGRIHRLAATPETARLARLLTHIEEGVRALVRRSRQAYRSHRQSSGVLHLLGRQLRHEVRRARTIPADGVFQGFRKMLRDVAQSEGKEIDFRTAGLDVQADRLVLQALKDPLVHALRNAVCHGIEPPDERRRQGKVAAGRVSLALEVQGSRLLVLVDDDGRGVDSRAVAEQAVRQRLLSEAGAASAGPEELNRLVFQPGFSTAREVTDLAGRGMGLSVVYEAVTRLQGDVQLMPLSSGQGTRLRIAVPLSLTAQRLLLVSCGGQSFAVPAHGVERLCRARTRYIEVVGGRPMLLLEGAAVPLQPLTRLLGLRDDEPRDPLPVLVVRSGPRRLAVSVEEMVGVRDSLIKDLGPPAGRDDRWAGGIFLEDGSVCLVLNPASLFDPARPASPSTGAATPPPRPAAKRVRTILVVDDSLTTRTLEKSILEAHGYRVVLALDGMEALARMRDGLPDLVISDVQMPRLDGFGLLEEIKKDPRLARVPVIIVTSLEKREDQERGLALGADAYVVKRKFDHEELLHTVQQIL